MHRLFFVVLIASIAITVRSSNVENHKEMATVDTTRSELKTTRDGSFLTTDLSKSAHSVESNIESTIGASSSDETLIEGSFSRAEMSRKLRDLYVPFKA